MKNGGMIPMVGEEKRPHWTFLDLITAMLASTKLTFLLLWQLDQQQIYVNIPDKTILRGSGLWCCSLPNEECHLSKICLLF